jgi:hypothetical protein
MIVALTTTDVAFVAAVAGVVGAAGGIGGAAQRAVASPKERQHQTDLARRQLLHDEMRSAYANFLDEGATSPRSRGLR